MKAALPHGTNKIKAKHPSVASVASDNNAALILRRRSSVESALAALAGTSDSKLATTY